MRICHLVAVLQHRLARFEAEEMHLVLGSPDMDDAYFVLSALPFLPVSARRVSFFGAWFCKVLCFSLLFLVILLPSPLPFERSSLSLLSCVCLNVF